MQHRHETCIRAHNSLGAHKLLACWYTVGMLVLVLKGNHQHPLRNLLHAHLIAS